MTKVLATLVEPDWAWEHDLVDGMALLGYYEAQRSDGPRTGWDHSADPPRWHGPRTRFRHRCDRGDRGVIICAPLLTEGEGGHVVTGTENGPTVTPSILCPDCGTHGFITDGQWRSS